ncbi:hypothetical protein [Streptomyces boncukensis]|uniref:Uncharacterized protein n=1 Tax=Streptomyces boncukensis TaxID=2711219 RepID=A0A6G4WRG3_9ACTN|nr:hypothetical protein [Streptomyces boncukensis]NGO67144.1 hypothetical protein [Streptomyces boncukensis]
MISVSLHAERHRVLLSVDDIAELVVDALAAEYAADPRGTADALDELARRRRTWASLSGLAEAQDLPEHTINSAAASHDHFRAALVSALSWPMDFSLSEPDARRLAADLTYYASLTTTARVRKGAAE